MNIETNTYSVRVSKDYATVILTGTLRLQGREQYQEVTGLLTEAADKSSATLTIDMRGLIFLNSSGISTLSLFIIEMRKRRKDIRIVGSKAVSWQTKTLYNFKRLYDQVEIDIR